MPGICHSEDKFNLQLEQWKRHSSEFSAPKQTLSQLKKAAVTKNKMYRESYILQKVNHLIKC